MTTDSEEPFIFGGVFLGVLAITLLVTLPGEALVARKLEAPGDEFRAFE